VTSFLCRDEVQRGFCDHPNRHIDPPVSRRHRYGAAAATGALVRAGDGRDAECSLRKVLRQTRPWAVHYLLPDDHLIPVEWDSVWAGRCLCVPSRGRSRDRDRRGAWNGRRVWGGHSQNASTGWLTLGIAAIDSDGYVYPSGGSEGHDQSRVRRELGRPTSEEALRTNPAVRDRRRRRHRRRGRRRQCG